MKVTIMILNTSSAMYRLVLKISLLVPFTKEAWKCSFIYKKINSFSDDIEPYEMEEFLEDVLNAEFDLKVEDNSIQEVRR